MRVAVLPLFESLLIALVVATTGCPESAPPKEKPEPLPPLEFSACGASFECATMQAPLDYDDESLGTMSIRVVRSPAVDPSARIGVLVVNFGGPGLDGVASFLRQYITTTALDSALGERFDIVGFDWRGVGESEPVDCVDDAVLDDFFGLDLIPDDDDESAALTEAYQRLVDGCVERTGEQVLAHVDTERAARDLDRLRASLGEESISYYGISYGTYLGAAYATLFPDRVRGFVLDGPLHGFSDQAEHARSQGAGYERALERFFDACAADGDCVFGADEPVRDAAALGARFDELLAQLEQAPIDADGLAIGPTSALLGVQGALRGAMFTALGEALAAAEAGDGAPLSTLASYVHGRTSEGRYELGMHIESWLAITCLDLPYPDGFDEADHDALLDELRTAAPHMGPHIASTTRACLHWPVRGTPLQFAAPDAPAVLIIAGEHDPATVADNAALLAQELDNGSYVSVIEGLDGHPPTTASACARAQAASFLLDPQTPPAACP